MSKLILLYIILICCYFDTAAQHAYFPNKGIISFEKEVYVRARMREMTNRADGRNRGMMMRFGGNIDDVPEKNSSMFTLRFDDDETLMTPAEEAETTGSTATSGRSGTGGGRGGNRTMNRAPNVRQSTRPGEQKVYYQNFREGTSELELNLDEKYLLQDSLQQITWRFTDEYRNIAGYDCRRVNGATPDSLYIVAFYTDQIPISGGPALVHGLPGMILGLAIPEMHINYWARKVDFVVDNVPNQWRDKKSKPMTMNDFFDALGNNRFFGGGSNPQQQRRNLLENLIY
ncbi:GLPGLI family protein [Sphingobacterium corticibacterium]|uniref:GLPGLI family protein n=1 Tax=Sphingobacterium corticibacterium TaxID=2484746 RepID=A0A4Q6XPD8_9SPHI|nr:GLPGLI family protein [Sphingobacterium corticibacterium]RZF58479.1 GLPGLI family protein [Sphingobacterium corticibacterium]